MANQTINFKDPLSITRWLKAAMNMEKEKYEKCPVKPDLVHGYEVAQVWGYVVNGYFLVEESFKAILLVRKKKVPIVHSLSTLFDLFNQEDKDTLREYYADYRGAIGGNGGAYPFKTLDDFLKNLDGDQNNRGDHIGSFDWRYFLIEEKRSQQMPVVSVDYLHELVYGCIRIIEYVKNGITEPDTCTHSWRMRWKREIKYRHWLLVRANSDEWNDLDDRLEILWGPDYRGRYDLYLFRGKQIIDYFSEIPDDFELPIEDKTKEIANFDVEEGFRSIGKTRIPRPPKN